MCASLWIREHLHEFWLESMMRKSRLIRNLEGIREHIYITRMHCHLYRAFVFNWALLSKGIARDKPPSNPCSHLNKALVIDWAFFLLCHVGYTLLVVFLHLSYSSLFPSANASTFFFFFMKRNTLTRFWCITMLVKEYYEHDQANCFKLK